MTPSVLKMELINRLALVGAGRALAGSIIWPFTSFALYKVYGLSLTFVSIFSLAQGVIGILAYLIGGYMTDYLGRVKVMILSASLSSLSLLLAFVLGFSWAVVSLILVQTFFNGVYNVANTTLVGDIQRNLHGLIKAFSRLRVGINAGWAVGPAVGGFIFYSLGFSDLLLISSVVSLPLILLIRTLPEFRGEVGLSLAIDKDFAKFMVPTFLSFMVIGQLGFPLLTFYNTVYHLSTFQVGLLFLINGGLIVIGQDIIGNRLNTRHLPVGMLLYSLAYFAVALCYDFFLASLDMVFLTVAEMIVSPLSQAVASFLTEKSSRGRKMGVYGMITSLGRTTGSSYTAFLMNFYLKSPLTLWGDVSVLGVLAAILYILTPIKELRVDSVK